MDPRLRTSLNLLLRILRYVWIIGIMAVVLWQPFIEPALNGQTSVLWGPYLIVVGPMALFLVGAVVLSIMQRRPARNRVNPEATDRTFRVSLVTPRLILGAGFMLLLFGGALTSELWVPLLWPGTQVKSEGDPVTAVIVVGGFCALVVALLIMRKAPPPPIPALSPGRPTVASGGIWSIADPSQLIAAPNGSARVHVTFVPGADFEATGIKAAIKAVETWVAAQDEHAQRRGIRSDGIQTVIELPLALTGPASYRAGQPVDWDVEFTLDGRVPPSCGDIDHLGCRWTLDISIDGSGGARLVQPILVTQPRDRVNSGAMGMAQFSRFEMASGSAGPIRVDFRVSPAPLDLAAPAVADVTLSNSGAAIACKGIRLEIWAQLKVTVTPAFTMQQILWAGSRTGPCLPPGESLIHFEIPAINRTWPDVDLQHGWMRGLMRLVVDIPSRRDICVERDLALCLDKPRRSV